MRKIALLCATVLLSVVAVSTSSWANGNTPQPVPQPAPPEAACAPPCEHTVIKRRVVGYEERIVPEHVARVPIYRKHKVVVKDNCCAPPVETQPVKVPEPEPQVVKVKKKIIVVEVPEIIHAPTPPITVIQRPPPHFVPRPPIVIAPPPPAVIEQQQVCCPPGANIPNAQPCPPVGSLTDDGLQVHVANLAPPGSVPCVRMVNGRPVTGHCW